MKKMNLHPTDYKKKKYTVKSLRYAKSSRFAQGDYISIDTSRYDQTKEEIARSIINSLKDAEKYLRGEIKPRKAKDYIEEMKKYAEEEKKNGKHPGRRGKYRGLRNTRRT